MKINQFYPKSLRIGFCSACLSCLAFSPVGHAAPAGGNVVGGSGSISTSGLTTNIKQSSQAMAIDWNSYNLNSNEIVNYLQPGASAISLNRILGGDASKIHGQINANGQVVLVNPNGIFFGQNASINVGGLIASGLDIDPVNFMNGDYIFKEVIGSDGAVINHGLINASLGGNVTLLGKQVNNNGLINAKLGAVNLAAGKEAVLTFDNAGLIGVRISKEVLQDELGIDAAVINSGQINSDGGRVLLSASVSRDVFSEAVNHGDLQQATSVVVNEDGSFSLGGGADVVNSGAINVSGIGQGNAGQVVILGENITHTGSIEADSNIGLAGSVELHAMDKTELKGDALISAQAKVSGKGGKIKLLGDKIGLFDSSEINASGVHGGGEVLVGGDRQGLNANVRNSEFLYLGEDTNIHADALSNGDGGRIITYANDTGRFYGGIYARGGALGGDGGFIETSGKKGFELPVAPDVSAVAGDGGLWLIDPYDITISNADANFSTVVSGPTVYTSTGTPATIDVGIIETALVLGDVEIITDPLDIGGESGDITFGADLNFDGTGNNSLTLNAAGGIIFQANVLIGDGNNADDSLNVNLFANNSVTFGINTSISTQGGNFTVGGPGGSTPTTFTNNGTIDTSGLDGPSNDIAATDAGNIDITVNGAFVSNVGSVLKATGGSYVGSASTSNSGDPLDGGNGGSITISAGSVVSDIVLDSSGGAARYDDNDNMGGASGGNGGTITITANSGTVTTNDLISDGGAAAGDGNDSGDGGSAGDIILISQAGAGTVNLDGDLNVSGQMSFNTGTDGTDGNITIDGNLVRTTNLTITANSFTSGNITASGAPNTAGNSITINATTSVSTGSIDTRGGAAGPGNNPGLDGGDIVIGAQDITVGTLTTIGSTATGAVLNNGGDGGAVTLTATEDGGTPSITLNGNINTRGGSPVVLGAVGADGTKTIAVVGSGPATGSININYTGTFTDGLVINGNTNDDTLTAANNFINTWDITPLNSGTLTGGVTFTSFENLTGGIGIDNFTLNNGVTLGGVIDGGTGLSNSITRTDGNNAWVLTGANSGDLTGTFGFTNIQTLNGGSGTDTITGRNQNNSWVITAANGGTVAETVTTPTDLVSFTGMENLIGGSQEDEFSLSGGTVIGSLDGGVGGTDTLVGDNVVGNNFTVTGGDSGTATGVIGGFLNIGNLTGNTLSDSFMLNGGTLSGSVDGAGANDAIFADNVANTWNIDGTNSGDVTGTAGFSNIEFLVGNANTDDFILGALGSLGGSINGGTNTDSLTGNDANNSWTSSNVGNGTILNAVSTSYFASGFLGLEELTGGTGVDDFVVTGANFIGNGLVIDGGDPSVSPGDTLNLSAMTGNVEVVLGDNVTGIELITAGGSNLSSVITGEAIGVGNTNSWELFDAATGVAGINDGRVTNENGTTDFIDFSAVNGSDRDDNFEQTSAGALAYTVDGLMGTDSVDLSGLATVNINVGASFSNGIVGIEGVIGNGTNSTINGSDAGETWSITGDNSGSIGTVIFTAFNIINGGIGSDIFDVTASGAITGPAGSGIFGNGGMDTLNVTLSGIETNGIALFDGGTGFDTLNLIGAAAGYDSANYSANNSTGVATIDYQTTGSNYAVNYIDAETISDGIQATDLVVIGTDIADTLGLTGTSYSVFNTSQTFDSVSFTNKTNVSIVGGEGIDIAQLNSSVNLGAGDLTFVTEEVDSGFFTITSQNLTLDGVEAAGTLANPLLTSVDNLLIANITNAASEIYIQETNGINLLQAGSNGLIDIIASNGDIGDSTTQGLVSDAAISLTANSGDIILDNSDNNLTGAISLSTSGSGSATVDNSGSSTATSLGTVNVGNLSITSLNADIQNTAGGVVVVSGTTIIDAGNNAVSLTNSTNNFSTIGITAGSANLVESDSVDLGASSLSGDLSVEAGGSGNITQSAAVSVAGVTNLTAVNNDITLDAGNNFNTVDIINAQNVTLVDSNSINLQSTNIAGNLAVTAGNNITNSNAGLSVSGDASFTAGPSRNITIDHADNNLAGILSFSGNLANVSIVNTVATNVAALTVNGDLTITSAGSVTQTGAFNVGDLTLLSAAGQEITLDQANNLNQLTIVTASNALVDNGNNNLNINRLVVDNNLILSAAEVVDGNGSTTNVEADLLKITSANGIGSDNELETEVSVMDVVNSGNGDIRFSQRGDVEFVALQNTNSNGTISIDSNGDYNFNPGSVDANRLQGTLEMRTSGDFLGVGDFDLNNADITAFSATFFNPDGAFGTPNRPIILDVPKSGNVLIQTSTTSFGFFPETPDDLVSEGIDLSIIGSLSATASEQLVEIESLSEVDPAIFTALRNYSQEEVSVRLPRDQLFDDELEEEDENAL